MKKAMFVLLLVGLLVVPIAMAWQGGDADKSLPVDKPLILA